MIETLREDTSNIDDSDNDTTKCFTHYYQLSPGGSCDETYSNKISSAKIAADMINKMKQIKPNLRSNTLRVIQDSKNEVLVKLLHNGGWSIIREWLLDARNMVDVSFIKEILQFYSRVPIIPKLIKDDDTCLQVVNAFTASPDEDIKVNSTLVVCKWKETMHNFNQEIGSVKINKSPVGQTILQNTIELDTKSVKTYEILIDNKSSNHVNRLETINGGSFKISKKRKLTQDASESEIANAPKKIKIDEEIVPTPPIVKPILKEHSANVYDSVKIKKSVTWVADDKICEVKLFEIIPGERTHLKMQSSSVSSCNLENRDNIETQVIDPLKSIDKKSPITWICIPIDLIISNDQPKPGCDSVEKNIQWERERHSLFTLYFDKRSIPDTPVEPESCTADHNDTCREIPLTNVDEIISQNISENNVIVQKEHAGTTKPHDIIQNTDTSLSSKPPSPNNPTIKTNVESIQNAKNLSKQENLSKVVCTFYRRGKCKFGSRCRNIHENATTHHAIHHAHVYAK